VTIAIGWAYDGGLLFCADTGVTGLIKQNQSKIVRHVSNDGNCVMVFASSAVDLNFPLSAISKCWEAVEGMDFTVRSLEEVHHAAEFSLAEFYSTHIYPHPDREPNSLYLQLLVGIWLRGTARLYLSNETVLNAVNQYECIGAGAYLAKYLIGLYRKANPGANSLQDAALISNHAVQAAIDYDARCGGKPEWLIIANNDSPNQASDEIGYLGEMFIDVSLELYWKMVRDLANMSKKDQWGKPCGERIDLLSKQLRDLDTSSKWGF
jgi:20S proteasome alpha/beta subunit